MIGKLIISPAWKLQKNCQFPVIWAYATTRKQNNQQKNPQKLPKPTNNVKFPIYQVYHNFQNRPIPRIIKCQNPDCGHDFFVPLSCLCFYLCPSCHQKRTLLFGEQIANEVLLRLPPQHSLRPDCGFFKVLIDNLFLQKHWEFFLNMIDYFFQIYLTWFSTWSKIIIMRFQVRI